MKTEAEIREHRDLLNRVIDQPFRRGRNALVAQATVLTWVLGESDESELKS